MSSEDGVVLPWTLIHVEIFQSFNGDLHSLIRDIATEIASYDGRDSLDRYGSKEKIKSQEYLFENFNIEIRPLLREIIGACDSYSLRFVIDSRHLIAESVAPWVQLLNRLQLLIEEESANTASEDVIKDTEYQYRTIFRRAFGASHAIEFQQKQRRFKATTEVISEITFEIDDQTSEDLGIATDFLRASEGVRNVFVLTGIGKKNRPTFQVQVLVDESHVDKIVDMCFEQTTTLGVRVKKSQRFLVRRAAIEVNTPEIDKLRVKVAKRRGAESYKIESDDIRGRTSTQVERELLRLRVHKALDSDE